MGWRRDPISFMSGSDLTQGVLPLQMSPSSFVKWGLGLRTSKSSTESTIQEKYLKMSTFVVGYIQPRAQREFV
jgi:hypothetical protein